MAPVSRPKPSRPKPSRPRSSGPKPSRPKPSGPKPTSTAQIVVACSLVVLLTNCSSLERLRNVGEQPNLDAIQNPTTRAGYKPVQMPMPAPQPAIYQPNSLWRTGSRAFFKDQRANQIGDILHRADQDHRPRPVRERDEAQPARTSENSGVVNFIGSKASASTSAFVSAVPHPDRHSNGSSEGKGSIDRKEELLTILAAVVTQVLPNGNLVLEGRQGSASTSKSAS